MKRSGIMIPEPRKHPKSTFTCFQAEQPNQCWQSDLTCWAMSDGAEIMILIWLDDHSCYALCYIRQHRGHDDLQQLGELIMHPRWVRKSGTANGTSASETVSNSIGEKSVAWPSSRLLERHDSKKD